LKGRGFGLTGALLPLALLTAILLAAGLWAALSPQLPRALWAMAEARSHGQLAATAVTGSLADGITLHGLSLDTAPVRLRLAHTRLALDWQGLFSGRARLIVQLQQGQLDLNPSPAAPAAQDPSWTPQAWLDAVESQLKALPVAVALRLEVDSLAVQRVDTVAAAGTSSAALPRFERVRLAATADAGEMTLSGLEIASDWGHLGGTARVDLGHGAAGAATVELQLQLNSAAHPPWAPTLNVPLQLTVTANGPVLRPELTLSATLGQMDAETDAPARLVLNGRIPADDGDWRLAGQIDSSGPLDRLLPQMPQLTLAGPITLSLPDGLGLPDGLRAGLPRPRLELDLALSGAALPPALGPGRLQLAAAWDGHALHAEQLRWQGDSGASLTARGQAGLSENQRLTLQLDAEAVAWPLPLPKGSASDLTHADADLSTRLELPLAGMAAAPSDGLAGVLDRLLAGLSGQASSTLTLRGDAVAAPLQARLRASRPQPAAELAFGLELFDGGREVLQAQVTAASDAEPGLLQPGLPFRTVHLRLSTPQDRVQTWHPADWVERLGQPAPAALAPLTPLGLSQLELEADWSALPPAAGASTAAVDASRWQLTRLEASGRHHDDPWSLRAQAEGPGPKLGPRLNEGPGEGPGQRPAALGGLSAIEVVLQHPLGRLQLKRPAGADQTLGVQLESERGTWPGAEGDAGLRWQGLNARLDWPVPGMTLPWARLQDLPQALVDPSAPFSLQARLAKLEAPAGAEGQLSLDGLELSARADSQAVQAQMRLERGRLDPGTPADALQIAQAELDMSGPLAALVSGGKQAGAALDWRLNAALQRQGGTAAPLRLAGTLRDPSGQRQLGWQGFVLGRELLQTLAGPSPLTAANWQVDPGELSWPSGGRADLSPTCLHQAEARVCLQAQQGRWQAEAQALPVPAWLLALATPADRAPAAAVSGTLAATAWLDAQTGEARLQWRNEMPWRLTLAPDDPKRQDRSAFALHAFSGEAGLASTGAARQLTLDTQLTEAAGSKVALKAGLRLPEPERPADWRLDLDADWSAFEPILAWQPQLQLQQPRLLADLSLAGAGNTLQNAQGELTVAAERLALRGDPAAGGRQRSSAAPPELWQTRLTLRPTAAATVQLNGRTRLVVADVEGGDLGEQTGLLQLTGPIDLRQRVARLGLRGERLTLISGLEHQVVVSPQLTLDLSAANADRSASTKLSGLLRVNQARWRLTGAGAVARSTDVRMADESLVAPNSTLALDVRVELEQPAEIAGPGFEARAIGGLQLRQQPGAELRASGQLEVVDGHYRFQGQRIELEPGSLRFADSPIDDPNLALVASRVSRDGVKAGVRVGGTASQPQLTLFSEPGLEQAEILSYLVTGRPLNRASNEQGALLAEAALGLGLEQANTITGELAQGFGLDALRLEATDSGGSSRPGVGVALEKRLAPDLTAEMLLGLTDDARELLLRYQITPRWQALLRQAESGLGLALRLVSTRE